MFYRGGYSVKITVGGISGNYTTFATLLGAFPAGGRIGLGVWVRFTNFPADWILRVDFGDPTWYHRAAVKGTRVDGKLWRWRETGVWYAFGDWYVGSLSQNQFRFIKFVFDTTTGEYVRCIVDGVQTNMGGTYYEKSAGGLQEFSPIFKCESDGSYYGPVNLDSVILTTAEP
jgi:hypothetical protein